MKDDINGIIKKAQDDLFPELEGKIRAELELKDKDWLIDQIILLSCGRHSSRSQKEETDHIKQRLTRISKQGYNDQTIKEFINKYRKIKRSNLEESGFLLSPPHLGLAIISPQHRSIEGEALLEKAQDMLYILLYGDEGIHVNLTREQEEVLTMILPKDKSEVLFFLKAVTQTDATGVWKDPEGVSNDDHAENTGLQVEFGDDLDGSIGLGIFVALNLINLLQVNEQVFYARMEKVGRSSLQSL